MTRPKKPRGGPRGRAKRYLVSVSRETFLKIQAARGGLEMTQRALVEEAVKGVGVEMGWSPRVAPCLAVDCADCIAERAHI